ncbi:MAG: 2,3-bisphosphoglycerate-independent phosphoglycerate mutase [Candidatus Kariarchaeaceae archaeon]
MNQGIVLVILDGFGIADPSTSNAISLAKMDTWNYLKTNFPNTNLDASGNAVGLPTGVMGNSEVGHLTIGTGRIQFQSLELINRACRTDSLKNNPNIKKIISHLNNESNRLHLIGLLSDGGVHSHESHLKYLIKIFNEEIENDLFIHAITDGRDTPPNSGLGYIQNLQDYLQQYNKSELATIIGRYYAMDRDTKWERTKIALDLYLNGIGEHTNNLIELIGNKYSENETDEFLKPIILDLQGTIREGDVVLFINFRPDRARQLSMAVNGMMDLGSSLKNKILYVTMTKYANSWEFPVLFDNPQIENCLAEVLSNNGINQVHIAETEKYAHVTYFLNGGKEKYFPNEQRILIPSAKVATYDLQPEMSTLEIANAAKNRIESNESEVIIVNIAAPDMVGHTGVVEATIKALEITDKALKIIFSACQDNGYTLIVTSDHGNCEKMYDNGNPHTAHTTNKVPFLITSDVKLKPNLGLSNIASTILELLELEIPPDMTGESMIERK